MAPRRTGEFRGAMEVALLLLPLGILLLLGVYFISRDRRWVEQEARERAASVARGTLEGLKRAAREDAKTFSSPTNLWTPGTAFLRTGAEFELIFPPPIAASEPIDPLELLDGVQSITWQEAERAEFELNDLELAEQAWSNLLQSNPPEPARSMARFKRAVLLEKMGKANEAYRELVNLLDLPAAVRLESGIPVAHLAAAKLLDSISSTGSEPDPAIAVFVQRNVLAQLSEPSPFTEYFLRAGTNSQFRALFEEGWRIWQEHQRARRLHERLTQMAEESRGLPDFINMDRTNWWVFRDGTNVLLRTEETLEALLNGLSDELAVPAHLKVVLDGGAKRGAVLARAADGALAVAVVLADPAALYAMQRERAWLFGGVLGLSALMAGAGIAQIRRNHRRQERLNELKSNFVSSVSHELRAPLASMRLMSEGLQSGRVRDEEKQREYFDFLVQESRRLSAVVENVLDFSRIEQNRKTYAFAEADARDLCEAALKTMGPVAREHGIALQFDSVGDTRAEVDSLALQQALVNLLDNAVKHSQPGAAVKLQLRSDPAWIEFRVEDRGCGIPAAEQERIFERFYRLGSELRRETQGVGIGLAIVKHTVEAHGGAVTVQSAPGQGATFILRVPRQRNNL